VNSGYSSYLWDVDDGVTSINQNTKHTYNSIGVYNGTVTVVNGCGNQATFPAQVEVLGNLPVGDIGWQIYGDTICPGDAMFFEADADDGDFDYLWTFGDGTTSNFLNVSHIYDNEGTYPIELTVTNGCGNDSTFFDTLVVSSSYQPEASDYSVFAQQEGCIGDELYFVLMPSGAGVISWDFGDGNSTSDVDQVLVQGITPVDVAFHAYNATGTYYAVYTITNACGNTVVDSIEINVGTVGDNVDLDVTFWWDESQTSCQAVQFYNLSSSANTYIWDFGDGVTSNVANPEHFYTDAGTYDILLIANNDNNCPDTIFVPNAVFAETGGTIDFPNAFTPNTSGSNGGYYDPNSVDNDVFFPVFKGVEEYKLMILNRWGELIFESEDQNIGWDGYYRDQLCQQDVYIWKAKVKFTNGKEETFVGELHLIR